MIYRWGIKRCVALVAGMGLVILAPGGLDTASDQVVEPTRAPLIHVVSPEGGGGHVLHPSSETKALIVLEITDTSRHGIVSDDFGAVRFQDPSKNVDLFASSIVAKGQYVNGFGQTITQLVALVPTERMQTGIVMTPPIDMESVGALGDGEYVQFTTYDVIQAAEFKFQVADRDGAVSDPKQGHVTIGLASSLWVPPETAIHRKPKQEVASPH